MHLALVSSGRTVAHARLSVQHAAHHLPDAPVLVLDVDGTYRVIGDERVTNAADLVGDRALHRAALLTDPEGLARWLQPHLVAHVVAVHPDEPLLLLRPGVVLLGEPTGLLATGGTAGLGAARRTPRPLPDDGRSPSEDDARRAGALDPAALTVRRPDRALLDRWRDLVDPAAPSTAGNSSETADGPAAPATDHWLEALADPGPASTGDPAILLTAWNLRPDHRLSRDDAQLLLDGRPVQALDLGGLDPDHPWLLDARVPGDPRARLSEHPALASLVRETAQALRGTPAKTGRWDPRTTATGVPVHDQLRAAYRGALRAERAECRDGRPTVASGQADLRGPHDQPDPPDPFDPQQAEAALTWLTAPGPGGAPSRYLQSIYASRADLRAAFPRVPGRDTEGFLRWAHRHGRTEEAYSTELVHRSLPAQVRNTPLAAADGPRPRRRLDRKRPAGVNVIGFLAGELGIGESARLMVDALRGAGVPHATVPVDRQLAGRRSVPVAASATAARFATSLVCVNADLVAEVVASVPEVVTGTHRIGMWYWEVENFPATLHHAFDAVDEVWVATEFVRGAIAPHSPVPVRTVTPPLPQRGAPPTRTRADLGLPHGPLFLFSFDYLSTAERKNPLGLVEAFTRAFAPGEGPVLVIKSINASRRPAQAERLRLRVADRPDVVLMEEYLDAADRDALVALCDCYVSLHRSEGLGLTMAEAMARGKPVIATGYSGNLQFMTEENSFLVPWTPTPIPADARPYPAASTWAEPDLDAAAAAMRHVVEHPDQARAVGERAAVDIATLHSPEVAGERVARVLAEDADRDTLRGTGRHALLADLGGAIRSRLRRH